MVSEHSQHHHATTQDSAATGQRPGTAVPRSQPPAAATLAELRASGHVYRGVKDEIKQNLLANMRSGQDPFPGIVGFGQTVLPHLERALIAGHDLILLGERGQGKTRLIRTLSGLLDEWTPAVQGCEINDHPYHPVCARCVRLSAELGDDLPVTWRHASQRYGEKLATPDTSVGDLNAFFLLMDRPSVYNLPEKPKLPQENIVPGFVAAFATAAFLTVATAFSLWSRKR